MGATFTTFRDPDCQVWLEADRVLRLIQPHAVPWVLELTQLSFLREQVRQGNLVSAIEMKGTPDRLVLEHERIEFPSYPHEWPPSLLAAAARRTLQLAREALPSGLSLKEATPYNVLFRGAKAVFVDWTSFERHDPATTGWRAANQFVECFLLPLLVCARLHLQPRDLFMARREGLDRASAARLLPAWNRLGGPAFRYITRASQHARPVEEELDRLDHDLDLVWRRPDGPDPAPASGHQTRQRFLEAAFRRHAPSTVLDIACKNGQFSLLAARMGAKHVVAVDEDPAGLDRLHTQAEAEALPVLPLQVNIARPTPPVGWLNSENPSFLQRMTGRFEFVLLLDWLHHLGVKERVPMERLAALCSQLSRSRLAIEFIGTRDLAFQRLLASNGPAPENWTEQHFESAWQAFFNIEQKTPLGAGDRSLYLMKRR